ncbi:Mediator of RNA polymerase II transcription subunit 6 [Kalmusia sp. IMI 367209]|nr:Mediator of RNA polymerase II transcription subunit 6 [Kalmusia sp. IMI 367209]
MAPQIPPQDEFVWESIPDLYNVSPGGVLTSDSILWYFMNSPFYDLSSNNHIIFNQYRGTPEAGIYLSNRHAFEEKVRSLKDGTMFVVVHEPTAEGEPWVIQRQEKILDREGALAGIEVRGTYYTQGSKIFMAKSVLDVLQLRLLAVSTQLQELFQMSKDMSHFSPATGHTYLPPSFELSKASATSRVGSRMGSPTLAAADAPSQSQSQSQSQPAAQADATTAFSDALFLRSLNLTETYFDEYVDENPLQGEPGSFVLSNTHAAILSYREAEEKKRAQAAQQAAAATAAAAAAAASQASTVSIKQESQSQSGIHSSTSTPKPATPAAIESLSRKASIASLPKAGKEKRRKSKGPGSLASPVTPTGPRV